MDISSDLLKMVVWDNLVKAALGRLFAALPALAWGPIGYVISFIVFKFTDALYEELKLWFNIQKILLSNESFEREYDRASVVLKVISRNHGEESDEYKKALEESNNAFDNVIKFERARRRAS